VLCADGPVRDLAGLSLAPEHRRGHGALYDAVNHGRVDIGRLRRSLAGLALPRAADGRLVLAADVSNWLRPGAATSPERLFCHVYGRGKGQAQMIPGWPYPVIAALEPGRTSWTAVLDAVRLGPGDDQTEVTAVQVREVVARLVAAGHWREGDLPVLVVFDAGYDVTRLAWLLADLPAVLPGRLRSDRVMWLSAPPRRPGTNGRPRKHGRELALSDPGSCPDPQVTTSTVTSRYGTAVAAARDRVHPRLTHRAAPSVLDHDGPLPVIEGTLIRLQVDYLPGDRDPKPVWLWWSRTGAAPADVDRCWQAFLRRFDLKGSEMIARGRRGYDAKKINGTRRHIAVDALGLLLTVLVTAASVQDRDAAKPLLWNLRRAFPTVKLAWADGGYAGKLVTWARTKLKPKLTLEIVKRPDDLHTFQVLPRRWVVGRTLSWITRHRRTVRDYERLPAHHETCIYRAMIIVMTRRLARQRTAAQPAAT
jgi:transposase